MSTRPTRRLLSAWGGGKGGAVFAPTRGLGRFFSRTKAVMGGEPMYSPHRVVYDSPGHWWDLNVFLQYNLVAYAIFCVFVFVPVFNTWLYYAERTYGCHRVPLPGLNNAFTDIDDPDWRLKREMYLREKREGPRPTGYNRYLDVMKGMKVSEPDFKPHIPSEHGEGVGPEAASLLQKDRAARAAALERNY